MKCTVLCGVNGPQAYKWQKKKTKIKQERIGFFFLNKMERKTRKNALYKSNKSYKIIISFKEKLYGMNGPPYMLPDDANEEY